MLIKKLFTHEDPFNIHKTMGILCLCNFVFQLSSYFYNRKMYLYQNVLIPHFLLNVTSFVFTVLKKRPVTEDGKITKKMAMFIWEELRVHSLIFSWRSCLCILYPKYGKEIVFVTLFLADIATYYLGTPNISTVRGNHDLTSSSIIKQGYSAFFSTSQMGATFICGGFFQDNPNVYLTFATLPAIQTSAFGMTLLRKNLISKEIWQAVYSLELVLVYILWYMEYGNLNVLWYSLAAYLMRKLGMNKYFLWALMWTLHIIMQDPLFNGKLYLS